MRILIVLMLISFSLTTEYSLAADKSGNKGYQGLDKKIQSLKKEVMELNSDLLVLEEELLFPPSAQLSVFFSLDVGKYIKPDSVQVKVDGKVVANHLYTEREIEALKRGGVQRIHLGNLRMGEHELVAYVVGQDWRERDIKLATKTRFKKHDKPKYIELQIIDIENTRQPVFKTKVWE